MWMWSNRRQYVVDNRVLSKMRNSFFLFTSFYYHEICCALFFCSYYPLRWDFHALRFFCWLRTLWRWSCVWRNIKRYVLFFILFFIFYFYFFIFFSLLLFLLFTFISFYLIIYFLPDGMTICLDFVSFIFFYYLFIYLFFIFIFYFFTFTVLLMVFFLFLAKGRPKLLKRGGLWQRRGLLHISFVTWLSRSYAICGRICSVRMYIHTNVRS